ncbi:hypothetical protein ACIGXM_01295 [Kitasatospora sp. NPDC052896]|uniref:hypothetical protein n=1 Tax=Kitasatospora sp. NPDC052896 TaxID=3364061 RepID=UPI0037C98ACC
MDIRPAAPSAPKARTEHSWTLPETDERYLRLSRFEVAALEPFTPVTAEEALAAFEATRQ